MDKDKGSGFSLLELLVALAILTLLLTLSVQSYQRQTNKVAISQAQLDLLALSAQMERLKKITGSYKGGAGSQAQPVDQGSPWIYPAYSPSQHSATQKYYRLLIEQASHSAYFLTAKPLSDGLVQLGYDSIGNSYWDKDNDGQYSSTENCWQC